MLTSFMLFMDLECKNYSTRNMKMNFNISYNLSVSNNLFKTDLEQQDSSIISTINQLKMNY
jgi:hypothetical protein